MNKLFQALNIGSFGNPEQALYPLFEALEIQR